ncbi:PAS domain-containing protein [Stakelama saccharophila]|uniref:histidine kinase n=1 Tax=Stakelama saccharophila TaxID=3075605 RepID=A0ABZ0B6N4_9SPHN|nr:PAS domain-containing protein [Stakelama sp. W311]WNO52872.1 PAS domain-containing protein [Stakelama sp. W311]
MADDLADTGPAGDKFLVLGVVAATFDDALADFLAQPEFAEIAVILCVVHQAPIDSDVMLETLRCRSVDAVAAIDGEMLVPGRVTVVPNGRSVVPIEGRLSVRDGAGSSGQAGRCDILLTGVAADCGDHAVGLVMRPVAGTATSGMAAVKKHGGMCVVEQTHSAGPDPASRPIESIADYVLPRSEIASCIARYDVHLRRSARSRSAPAEEARTGEQLDANLARRAARIADRYAPAYVVVDDGFDILHFSGRMGRYLEPKQGTASLSLPLLVHHDLRSDLHAALRIARDDRDAVRPPPLAMEVDGETEMVRLVVEPVDCEDGAPRNFVVLFQSAEFAASSRDREAGKDLRGDDDRRLESELRQMRERRQETTEELGAANREPQTANGELGQRVAELARANADLKNFLESTRIATVFLDDDLRVRNFTPAIADIFHLIESDLGRPLMHIAGRIDFDDLSEDVRRVVRTRTTIEREVHNQKNDRRYLVRILPCRSGGNFIGGVVLTFLDISDLARTETALRESDERFRGMVKSVPIELFTADAGLHWDYVNERFYEFTGMPERGVLGHGWMTAVHPDDLDRVRDCWLDAGRHGGIFQTELRFQSVEGGFRSVLLRAEAVRNEAGAVERWYGSASDISEMRLATEHQKLLMAELQHRVKNILAVVRSIFSRTLEAEDSVEQVASHFRGRIDALARTQTILARSPQGQIELEELVRDELLSVDAPMDGMRIRVRGPSVHLFHKPAETLGLAVHELVTNAVKYGALALGGEIDIFWSVDGQSGSARRLHFTWEEKGVPMVSGDIPREGFGSELIERGLPYQLGATTAFELRPGGVRCVIDIPLIDDMADAVFSRDAAGEEDLA